MSESAKNKILVVHLTVEELALIVQDAIKAAIRSAPKEDRLLTVEQACEILRVRPDWIYHRTKTLPFIRKVGGLLRVSANALQRYIEVSKFKGV